MSEAAPPAPAPAAAPKDPSRGLARKVLLGSLIGAAVFVALALYGDVQALRENLGGFRWEMLAGAIALASANYALRFVRWQYYLRRLEIAVPSGESALIFLAGFVMSVTPGKVGEVFKSFLLWESRGTSIARTAPVVIAERLTDLVGLVILIAIGSTSFERGFAITIGAAALVGAILIACAWRPVGELGLRVAAKLPVIKKASPKLREAYESLYVMTRPGPLLFGTAIGAVAWWLECVALSLILMGFEGAELGARAATFAYSTSTIAGALAMMPGGLGVTEAGMTGLLQALGGASMTPAVATAATMLVRLATLWWAVGVGAVALALFRRSLRHRLRPVKVDDRETGRPAGRES
jgi:uncharacterized protein (TIRG00374 family)